MTTNRRTYYLTLVSSYNNPMLRIGFLYPQDPQQAFATAAARGTRARVDAPLPDTAIDKLDFNYQMNGDRGLQPVRVFNDGTHTYLQMPHGMREVPVLFAVGSDGSDTLVNYRFTGQYYVVDGVPDEHRAWSKAAASTSAARSLRAGAKTMDPKHVPSPVELVEKTWRGPILGVIKISAKAGFIAALLLAALVGLIVYGISTAGHRRAANANGGASLTKASEQQAPWWNAIPNAQPTALRLPTIPTPARVPPLLGNSAESVRCAAAHANLCSRDASTRCSARSRRAAPCPTRCCKGGACAGSTE